MTEKYTDRIKAYCDISGFEIPVGFYRHPASRYAVIDLDAVPPKLVARTWFKQEDVLHFLRTFAIGKAVRVLDFKERQELSFDGSNSLTRLASF